MARLEALPSGTPAAGDIEGECRKLEYCKLRHELDVLQTSSKWLPMFSGLAPIATAIVALGGFWWGIRQYREQENLRLQSANEQWAKEQETAQRELMKPWLQEQRSIYDAALKSAGNAINGIGTKRAEAKGEFWALYQGQMILVETKKVSNAMVSLGECLKESETCSDWEKNARLRKLATEMAHSMAASAKENYAEFSADQFQYAEPDSGIEVE